ncbi:hypothetical protein B566_EDAN000483 [Ephemera danica]|nr:hypothetical protein B566_EDAN000483 [Ephemera danica]
MDRETKVLTLPILPIKRTVLFPGIMMPLTVGRERSMAAVHAAMKTEEKMILVVAQRDAQTEEPSLSDLYTIGTKAIIKQIGQSSEGSIHAFVQGVDRVAIIEETQSTPYAIAKVRSLDRPSETGTEIQAMHRAIQELVTELPRVIQAPGMQEASDALSHEDDPVALAYRVASLVNLSVAEEQKLLERTATLDLLRALYVALSKEIQILQLRDKITSDAQAKIGKNQREYMLREQLKTIQQELGESDSDDSDLALLQKKVAEADLPDPVRKEVERELGRLAKVPPTSADHQVLRTYLELVLELPWKTASEDHLNLATVRHVLEEDHYGIKEVKDRIVEHLAVLKLNPAAKAPILCLVGPPGVGKTSLGQSVARAMGRTFERISLGGVHDEAELRGHRRTYVGALPGHIIQAVRRAEVNNPVLMLDEVDKMGRDFRGDPSAALLEILDPAQNHTKRVTVRTAEDLGQALGLSAADTAEMEFRSELTVALAKIIQAGRLTHAAIAKSAGTSRTRVTALANGNTHGVSTDVLIRVLAATGHRAEVRIEIVNVLTVGESTKPIIDRAVQTPKRIIGGCATRKDAQQKNLGLRKLRTQQPHNRLHSGGRLLRWVFSRPRVVGADHHHRRFRMDAVDLAMLQPPQHLLSPVAVESQIHCPAMGIVPVPHLPPRVTPPLCDGIADHQQIDRSLSHARHIAFMLRHPPAGSLRSGNDSGNITIKGTNGRSWKDPYAG